MSSFLPVHEIENIEVPSGTQRQLSGALKGWTLWHLDAAGKAKYNSGQDWRLTAGPAHIRKLNTENAERGLPALKENFRKLCETKEEALAFVVKYTPQTLESEFGNIKVPPYLKRQLMTVVTMIVGGTIARAKDINVVTAVERESKRLNRVQKTVKELIVLRGKRIKGGFDVDHKDKHLQHPRSNSRLISRLFFTVIDVIGHKMVYDVTPADAKLVVEEYKKRAKDENRARDRKELGDSTLFIRLRYVVSIFAYALEQHWCDLNPFEELFADISAKTAKYDKERKKRRKPHPIDLLQVLLRHAWQENKLMCLAFVFMILEGLRRCEVLRAPGKCVRLTGKYHYLRVDADMAKESTEPRSVPLSASFRLWLRLYPDLNQFPKLFPFPEGKFAKFSRALRDAVGFPGGGKDILRKNWTLRNQGDQEMPDALRAFIEGHSEKVMKKLYDGEGDDSPEYTEEFDDGLDPVSVFGFMPETCTAEELMACVPKPGKGGGRSHKKFKAKMKALLLEKDKSTSPGQ